MIHSLSIKNFLSFKDEVTISFEATRDTHLEEQHVYEVADGVRLLKFLILYGYNASGKSNLIRAFQFLRDFWFTITDDKDEEVETEPFLLDNNSRKNPSEFKLIFYHDKTKYAYYLSAFKNIVVQEKLEFYPGVQPAVIFDRIYENGVSVINFGNKIKVSPAAKDEISIKCLPNISVFAAYNQVNVKIEGLNNASIWMKENVMPSIEPLTYLQSFTEKLVSEDAEIKQHVLNYLQKADFNISGIDSKEIEREVPDEFISHAKKARGVSKKEIERLEKDHTIKFTETIFLHSVTIDDMENSFPIDFESQSDGTKRIFGLAGAIFKTIEKNAFLPIDEIESKLHPRLIEYVIEQFLRYSKQSQLLVATHYDNLFDEDDLLRKDNFWFTEKGEDGATKLYPLSGFKGLGRISSLQKAYKFGKFGAVPNID
ncbi:MAG: ATP-binding protein [Bacteroidetes bacterium]|nr:MAG: ATP-binding protein [Bacteroidota bacterium]